MTQFIDNQIDILVNDLYQFTCSYSYFQTGKHQDEATFEVFFRKYPFGGEYTIFAGLEDVRRFISNFRITPEHEEFLRQTLPQLSKEYFEWIRQDFSKKIKINAFKEGSIVFAKEPLISYTGPLGFVQLLQTPILNLVGFASLVATNASRMVKAVHPKACVQFGLRRAQGPNGGLTASAFAYLGGFSGTSNMKASQLFGIPCLGSMSHAFITSFTSLAEIEQFQINGVKIKERSIAIRNELGWTTHDGELTAFLAFAKTFPTNFKSLIDTYSTIQSGMRNTIVVGMALIEAGIFNIGIRLDSGDLCELSKQCRMIWNEYVPDHKLLILASDDLHEERLIEMEKNNSEIDIYAIGTNIATCKKQPALGLVCKLTQINGTPKMKLSSDPEKATYPGRKLVYRAWTNSERSSFDILALDSENIQLGELQLHDNHNHSVVVHQIKKLELLNEELILSEPSRLSIKESREFVKQSMKKLPEELFELKNPHKHKVLLTKHFYDSLQKTVSNNTVTVSHGKE